jgi:uncharacterized protein (TIGR03083 family)
MTDDIQVTKAELLSRMQQGWDDFNAYLNTLTEAQLTGPTDAAGWTAKDHLMHLAVWEDGVNALLEKQSRSARMGVDDATWEGHDFDQINAVIQRQHRDKPLGEVQAAFRRAHETLVAKLQSMSDEDILRPYSYYVPGADLDRPVVWWIVGNTFSHYAEHQPWIDAIVKSG